ATEVAHHFVHCALCLLLFGLDGLVRLAEDPPIVLQFSVIRTPIDAGLLVFLAAHDGAFGGRNSDTVEHTTAIVLALRADADHHFPGTTLVVRMAYLPTEKWG